MLSVSPRQQYHCQELISQYALQTRRSRVYTNNSDKLLKSREKLNTKVYRFYTHIYNIGRHGLLVDILYVT